MTNFNSKTTEVPGQYPTETWHEYGLPEQNFGSGAAGTAQPSTVQDQGKTNEPGQYPDRDDFTGVVYSLGGAAGSGAPGSTGAPYDNIGQGPDTVTYDKPTTYKSQYDDGNYDEADGGGFQQNTTNATISGKGDWTQANAQGYQADARFQMPGVAGNTPAPGDAGRYQTDANPAASSGHVMYGGFLNGQRPSTPRHPSFSGPGT